MVFRDLVVPGAKNPDPVSADSRPYVTGRRSQTIPNISSDVSSIRLSTKNYTRVPFCSTLLNIKREPRGSPEDTFEIEAAEILSTTEQNTRSSSNSDDGEMLPDVPFNFTDDHEDQFGNHVSADTRISSHQTSLNCQSQRKRPVLECGESVLSTKRKHMDDSYSDSNDDDDAVPSTSEDEAITSDPLPLAVAHGFQSLDEDLKPSLLFEDAELLRREISDLKIKLSELEKEMDTLIQNLRTFLNCDQLDNLKGNQHENWCEDTIKRARQIESACGYIGYRILIEQGYPLPSYKTLFIRTSGNLRNSPQS